MDKEIIIRNATKEKADIVDNNFEAIISNTKKSFKVEGLLIKRIKNIFIVL